MLAILSAGLLSVVAAAAERDTVLSPQGKSGFSVAAVKTHEYDHGIVETRGDEKSSIDVAANWFIPVSIGTPPQSFLFLGDSGATGLAVGSTLLPKEQQSNSPKYNPDNSTTAKKVSGYTYNLCFGSGFCSGGVVYTDKVTVGNLTVDDMDVEVQTHNNGAGTGARSGTLGLDFDKQGLTTHPKKLPNWLQRVMPTLQLGVFTVDFNANTSKGTFDFGYIDASKYNGKIGYADVKDNATEWVVNITKQVLANGSDGTTAGWPVVIDTGTAGSNVPREVADDYFSQVKGAAYNDKRNAYTYPCSSLLVDFTFVVDSVKAVIPAAALKGKSIDGGNTCASAMGVKSNGTSLWGQSFIEQLFLVFDWDNGRVGFANKQSAATGAASSSASATSVTSQTPSTSAESKGNSLRLVPSCGLAFTLVSFYIIVAGI